MDTKYGCQYGFLTPHAGANQSVLAASPVAQRTPVREPIETCVNIQYGDCLIPETAA